MNMLRHSVVNCKRACALLYINYMIMIQIINMNYMMRIVLMQVVLWNVINAEFWSHYNVTSNDILQKSGRPRRAPFHRYIPADTLTATIQDGEKQIHLTWKRVERYLVNKHLPIYTVQIDSWGANHKKSDIMNRVGNFITYHDNVHKSAVMYFENMDKLSGIVGTDYEIYNLPIDSLSRPILADSEYIRKTQMPPHVPKMNLEPILEDNEVDDEEKHGSHSEQHNHNSLRCHQNVVAEHFYVEILLFVTHDVVQYFTNRLGRDYLYGVILNYLLHFNAIDMVFANLPVDDFKIYLNLAGIIVEEEYGAFNEVIEYPELKSNDRNLHVAYIFDRFQWYPDHFDFPFTKDSYDVMYISTGRDLRHGCRRMSGLHSDNRDIFEERQNDNRFTSVPIILVQSTNTFESYCMGVHQIGNVLGIGVLDPIEKGITYDYQQCYGVMQAFNRPCTNCIRWSDESVTQLRAFFSYDPNRCFLLNEPRSLYPPGTRLVSLTPCRQCTCFGFHSYAKESYDMCPRYIPSDSCDVPLKCRLMIEHGELSLESAILPFDGTPCGDNKVCWSEQCKPLS